MESLLGIINNNMVSRSGIEKAFSHDAGVCLGCPPSRRCVNDVTCLVLVASFVVCLETTIDSPRIFDGDSSLAFVRIQLEEHVAVTRWHHVQALRAGQQCEKANGYAS